MIFKISKTQDFSKIESRPKSENFENSKILILDFSKISKSYPKFVQLWNAVTFSLLDRFWKFWMFQKALDLYFPTAVSIFRIPSGQPLARYQPGAGEVGCDETSAGFGSDFEGFWAWVLRNQPEALQRSWDISKMKGILILRISKVFDMYLLSGFRCGRSNI